MTEQALQCMKIDTGFQHMGGEGVAEQVDATRLLDLGALLGASKRVLERRRTERAGAMGRRNEILARLCASPVLA